MFYFTALQRAGSKNSLYASRSSLYGRRRRKGSNAESLYSYRDDTSVHRNSGYRSFSDEDDFDGYEKPLSRRDKERLYRSENDLGRNRKEISTQTLRETATQTGPNESVVVQQKMLVKKKKKARSVSTSGTQTDKKKNAATKSKSRAEEKLSNREKTVEKRKSKRSKSLNALDVDTADTDESPRPKPKPKPRKSASSNKLLDSVNKSASVDDLANAYNQPTYYPQSEGFVPHGYPPQTGYPGMAPHYPGPGQYPAPPQYPGQPAYRMQGMPPPSYNVHNMYPPPPQHGMPTQPQPQPIQRKPKKSNWELLCEMTDGEYQYDDVTETGSVASSVFTNNPHSSVPAYQNQAGPQPPYLTNAYPSSQQQFGQPTNSGNQTAYNKAQEKPAGKESSWEALKRMTNNTENQPTAQPSQKPAMPRNESIV